MPILPSNVPTGKVTGNLAFVSEGAWDADTKPELTIPAGTVTFTASVETLRMPAYETILLPLTFEAVLDFEGNLVPKYGTGIGIDLPATNSPFISEQDFTYRVDFALQDAYTGKPFKMKSFNIQVPVGTSKDLSTLIPIDESGGVITLQGSPGKPGLAATVTVGTTATGNPGTNATVTQSGTEQARVLNFTIPRGAVGETGPGVPAGGTALQLLRKNTGNTTTEWTTPTKALVGLGNVDNTSDASKPVSTAQATALGLKADLAPVAVAAVLGTYPSLDTFKDSGKFHFGSNASITDAAALGFPTKAAGLLDVSAASSMVYQTYMCYSDNGRYFWRGFYTTNNAWSAWSEVPSGKTFKGRVAFGTGALKSLDENYGTGPSASIIALGYEAMGSMTQIKTSIAIGGRALGDTLISRDNIAIGGQALQQTQSDSPDYDQSKKQGTRNVAIGGLAGYFNVKGWGHTLIGRGAGQCLEAGNGLVAIGASAAGGAAPIGLTGDIENGSPWNVSGTDVIKTVLVGHSAGTLSTAKNVVAVGGSALLENKKSDYNTAVGANALSSLDKGTGPKGGTEVPANITGTYTQSGSVLTMNIVGHTLAVGDTAQIRLLDGASQTFQGDRAYCQVASVPNANTFTVVHPISRTASGTSLYLGKETTAQIATNPENVAVGFNSAAAMLTGSENTFVGSSSAPAATVATRSTVVGKQALFRATSLDRATTLGYYAAGFIGGAATEVTAVGANALRGKIDGSTLTESWSNITGIGSGSAVSGADQVQLGNSSSTTYVYGTVQNRSDARDKADVRDTTLGLDFINELRPVDYKWDMRDDYFEEDEEGNRTPVARDGSKKRSRYHHGVIAQELPSEFGGVQDHSVNGGSDVLSVGYDEFIAPLIKAVQELSAEVTELKAQLAAK